MKSMILIFLTSFIFVNNNPSESKIDYKFVEFLSLFEPLELPTKSYSQEYKPVLKKVNVKERNDLQSKMMAFIPDLKMKFSRVGPPRIEPVGRFYPSEQHVAVIYKSYHPFEEGNYSEKMVIFELNGKPSELDIQNDKGYILLSYSNPSKSHSFNIDSSKRITLVSTSNEFEEPYRSGKENKVVSVTTTRNSYAFDERGAFVKLDKSLIANAE